MRIMCSMCQGTGIGEGMRSRFGELMNLCTRCDGHGIITTDQGERPFIAIFPVSERYVVHMQVPRRKGGHVMMDIQWSPRVPPERGNKALTLSEKAAYERGRNGALAALMDQLGGGDFSVVTAQERH